MSALVLGLLAVVPPSVVERLPELALPLTCPASTSPRGLHPLGITLSVDETTAVRKTLAAWAAEDPGRIDGRVGQGPVPTGSDPINVGLRLYGKLVVSARRQEPEVHQPGQERAAVRARHRVSQRRALTRAAARPP